MNFAVGKPHQAVDCKIVQQGNKLVGIDVDAAGEESIMRSNLGTYASPEHALAMKMLWDRDDFLILVSLGRITDETVDKMAEAIRKLKDKKTGGRTDGVHAQ